MGDWKKIAVAVAIAILFAVFVGLLIDLVYEQPNYADYCKEEFGPRPAIIASKETLCGYEYGEEYQKCVNDKGLPRFTYNASGCPVFNECDLCYLQFDDALKVYNRNVFIIASVIGLVAIFAGTLWKIEFLGTGLMFGGILLLFYGTARFFPAADKLLRVIIIFAELLIVIWIGYKKLYKNGKKQKKAR